MSHLAGVRLQLRRKDCINTIALVDVFQTVWIAGWKQKEHPMLHNALHLGDQLLSVAGKPVSCSTDAHKLIRAWPSLYVSIIAFDNYNSMDKFRPSKVPDYWNGSFFLRESK